MPTVFRYLAAAWLVIVGASISSPSFALTAAEIDGDVDAALASLYGQSPEAKELADTAKGILVFPKILKAGFIVGGQGGEGALRVDGATAGYYNTVSGSFGLQAGVQTFGYAMFFVNDEEAQVLEGNVL